MTSNFKIKNFIEIEFEDRVCDLHNNFSFVSFSYDKEADELKIFFNKSTGNWVSKNEFDKLTFTLSKINYLKTIDPKAEILSEDHQLSEITYFYSDDREENYGLLDREKPEIGDDIIFIFGSDRVIRANCDIVTVTTEKLN